MDKFQIDRIGFIEHLSFDTFHDGIRFRDTIFKGQRLAGGDINNDGLDDIFVTGSRNFQEKWFIQRNGGTFVQQEVAYEKSEELEEEDVGISEKLTPLVTSENRHDLKCSQMDC